MPPAPPPTNVYPCLDWVPQNVARRKPDKLRLTNEELKTVILSAKQRVLESRRRLGHVIKEENAASSSNNLDVVMKDSQPPTNNDQDDDAIMKEYGLDTYDDENEDGTSNQPGDVDNDISEDDNDENSTNTRGIIRGLASEIAGLTYHASNEEDPYLRANGTNNEDDDEDEENLIIKPTDNLIVAGHVSKEESSLEVYVYDNESSSFYLHHDIMQADFPCCVRWIGHLKRQSRNIAAVGYMNPDILLWDLDVVDVLEPIETLSGHKDAVIDMSWNSHTKSLIASGSADEHVRLWDIDECKSTSNIKMLGKVSALEFGIYEQFLLLSGDLDKNVGLIDTRSSSIVHNWKLGGEVEKVRWIPSDHTKFLVSDDQGWIYCFDTRNPCNGLPHVKFHAHETSVTGLEFSPKCEEMLVTASADDTVKVWDIKPILKTSVNNIGEPPTLIKEITDLKVGNILCLRMCPNSLARIAIGGDSKCKSFTTYDLTLEKEVKARYT